MCVYGGNLRKQANYRTDPTALREATVVQSNVTQGEGLLAKAKDHAQVTQLDAATCYEGGGNPSGTSEKVRALGLAPAKAGRQVSWAGENREVLSLAFGLTVPVQRKLPVPVLTFHET